MLAITERISR